MPYFTIDSSLVLTFEFLSVDWLNLIQGLTFDDKIQAIKNMIKYSSLSKKDVVRTAQIYTYTKKLSNWYILEISKAFTFSLLEIWDFFEDQFWKPSLDKKLG